MEVNAKRFVHIAAHIVFAFQGLEQIAPEYAALGPLEILQKPL